MRLCVTGLFIWLMIISCGCAVVTVPLKVVGKTAEVTVEAVGTIIQAPFKLMSGGGEKKEESKEKD